MLLCHVVLAELGPGRTRVTIADPRQLMADDALAGLAAEAADRLKRVGGELGLGRDRR